MKAIRSKTKNLAAGAGVALATTGLSTCNNNGAVDPPPPPVECNNVNVGQTMSASATLSGRSMQVTFRKSSEGDWGYAILTSVVGGVAQPIVVADPLVATILLNDASVTEGSFLFSGGLRITGGTCNVNRTFRFTVRSGDVTVASADELPLGARQQARIGLVERDGNEVVLEASTPFTGPQTASWTVTGGQLLAEVGGRMRWRLPAEPGLYQAELVIDYGSLGLSFDALALEVT